MRHDTPFPGRSDLAQSLYDRYADLHHRLSFLINVTRVDDASAALPIFNQLDDEFRAQFMLIQQQVLPELDLSAPELADLMRDEQQQLKALLGQVAFELAQSTLLRGAGDRLLTQLDRHMQHVSRGLLPWLDTRMSRRLKARLVERLGWDQEQELPCVVRGPGVQQLLSMDSEAARRR